MRRDVEVKLRKAFDVVGRLAVWHCLHAARNAGRNMVKL